MGLKVNQFSFRVVAGAPSRSPGESIAVKVVLLAIVWGFTQYMGAPRISFVWLTLGFITLLIGLSLLMTVISLITNHPRFRRKNQ